MVTFILPLVALQWDSQSVENKSGEELKGGHLSQCEVQIIGLHFPPHFNNLITFLVRGGGSRTLVIRWEYTLNETGH